MYLRIKSKELSSSSKKIHQYVQYMTMACRWLIRPRKARVHLVQDIVLGSLVRRQKVEVLVLHEELSFLRPRVNNKSYRLIIHPANIQVQLSRKTYRSWTVYETQAKTITRVNSLSTPPRKTTALILAKTRLTLSDISLVSRSGWKET